MYVSIRIQVYCDAGHFYCSSGEYFPKAKNDLVSVWEDESIAFSTLDNDYFAGHNASVVEFSKVRVEASVLVCIYVEPKERLYHFKDSY